MIRSCKHLKKKKSDERKRCHTKTSQRTSEQDLCFSAWNDSFVFSLHLIFHLISPLPLPIVIHLFIDKHEKKNAIDMDVQHLIIGLTSSRRLKCLTTSLINITFRS
jgi:hypothetical protein